MQQASTKKTEAPGTRERLLEAAMKVFCRDGLYRATTRVIAEEAGVNEVTLFRHFQNKDGLLSEVMKQVVETMTQEHMGDEALWTSRLRENLLRFAHGLYDRMSRDEAFIRTMIGEAHRHPEHARQIILDTVRPVRNRFLQNLEAARNAGLIRQGVDLNIACECLTGMLLSGMLKITSDCAEGFDGPQYVDTCVEIFHAGIAAPASQS
ncbi:MAG: TetR/AcrR family transcriptional regulator [Verrucomicrobium sp.]